MCGCQKKKNVSKPVAKAIPNPPPTVTQSSATQGTVTIVNQQTPLHRVVTRQKSPVLPNPLKRKV